jgi:uncharacterized membrane protein YfcA
MNARTSERGLRLAFALPSGALGLRLAVPFGLDAGGQLALGAGAAVLLVLLGLAGGVIAGLLGVGGSLIVIAVMVIALDTCQVAAQSIALAAVIPTAVVGAAAHRRLGSLDPRSGLVVGVVGAAAAVPGVFVAFALPTEALRTFFGAFLVLNSVRMLRAPRAGRGGAVAEG